MHWYVKQFGLVIIVLSLFCAADVYYNSQKLGYTKDVDTGMIWSAVGMMILVGLIVLRYSRKIRRGDWKPKGTDTGEK